MKKLILIVLLFPFFTQAEVSEKDFIIDTINITCAEHKDPEFCRWQVENISAVSSINTLTYYRCKLDNKKDKECLRAVEMFDYIQGQYDKNMNDMKKQ
ncbi:TPA: hypothetical protein SMO99_001608 [Proteus mirabilis]|uniref:Uncharacterized protein n=2 Tax=Morganellaceae TaxID=1903414 RepID=A0A6G6SKN8_PROVU|nr:MULTISPECIES: hypothetical protein [Proteus]MBG3107815.1 hypothetical protein [Proteus mirabilis]MBI6346457.1 hypothetical protein [Proteus mirabilis]MDK6198661.1 hypothetical protein [Proteus mirabilis]MDM3713621.1 hypothetical protein [Proteus mirabilis]QFV08597.1 hypothetical protein GD587_15725 [Proteus mirabilis]